MTNIQVVIADDDASMVALLEKRLNKAGYVVSCCGNGNDALGLVHCHKPVILLADWEMPGLTGVKLCRELQDTKADGGIYIILLTGNGEPDQVVAGFEAGADDYLVKPAHPAELIARVRAGERVLELQDRLGRGEQWLRTVVDASKDAMIAIDSAGLVTLFNRAAETMFGRSAQEMLGQALEGLMPEEHRTRHRHLIQGYFARGEPKGAIGQVLELSAVRSDGRQFPIEPSLSTGECRGEAFALAVVRDITERKRAEEGRRQLTRAIEAAAEAIVLTDVKGRILQVNPAFTTITGYAADEAIGQTPRLLKSGKQTAEFYERLWGTIRSGEAWAGRIIDQRKNGAFYVADLTIAPITGAGGTVTGYVGVQRDITVQVEREKELTVAKADAEGALARLQEAHAQLLQADKMASIGHLAAGVAHEINNPIGFITSNLNSLSRYVADIKRVLMAHDELLRACHGSSGISTAKAQEVVRVRKEADIDYIMSDLVDLITESTDGARRVRQIVADLKDFSHVDSPDVADEDINQLLEKTVNVAWNELKYKTEVVREYGDTPVLPCHGGKLGQVFLNLLVNAAQAIEERGTITIRTQPEDGCIRIEIADTGRGIPSENLNRIFDPFFTTKEVGKGTGLGLHLAHKIVQAHGGHITVESRVGEGTTFRIELPIGGPPETQEKHGESVA